jgi:hypothetical protein
MAESKSAHQYFLSGREFTAAEIQDIRETIESCGLSRRELIQTICEHLNWVTPTGQYKMTSCSNALGIMEARGWVRLPAKMAMKASQQKTLIGEQSDPEPELKGTVRDHGPIEVEPVGAKEQMKLWNEYVERYHPLGFKRPWGAHQRYFIQSREGRRMGCLMFAAAAWALAQRDQWIGWTRRDRVERLNWVVANTRFLIFPWVRVRNLASTALSLAARRIGADWQERYGYAPVLLETFVEPQLYPGTCYQAANWIRLGMTQGRGRDDRHTQYLSTPKILYVYPLRPDFRSYLCGGNVRGQG